MTPFPLRTHSSGTTWSGGDTPGTTQPLKMFHVVKPGDVRLRPVRRALPEIRRDLERQRRAHLLLPERDALRPPSQAAWRTGANGYAAYKVGDRVRSHEAWGLGSDCYFNVDPSIHADRGFEVPDVAGVRMHDLSTVSLGGVGVIDHAINATGAAAQGADTIPSTVTSHP